MRITHGMLTTRMLGDLQRMNSDIAVSQREVSTGRRVNRAGDDPMAARAAVLQREQNAALSRYSASVSEASGFTEATDKALGGLADLLHRARELAIQGANAAARPSDLENIAAEIDQLAAAAKDAMSAKHGEQYLFSGTATTTRPYDQASDAYLGDGGAVVREIGPGVTVQVNTLGSAILGGGQAANDGRLLDTLRDLADHLRGATTADLDAIRTTDLAALEANLVTLSQARATNGATASRLEAASRSLGELELAGATRLSGLEDVDMAKAIVDLSSRQSAYQSALRAGASVMNTSLMDFLR